MSGVVRIGTRRSPLAMRQSRIVAEALSLAHPGLQTELVPLVTEGDRRAGALAAAGGKGLFTAGLEAALRAGRIHLAVHSAKDLPVNLHPDFAIVAVPPREDPRDALASAAGWSVERLPANARVGTGSLRRRAQLLAVRGALRVVPVRGNVETRLAKAVGAASSEAALDAVVVAMAGLVRLALTRDAHAGIVPLPVEQFIPAAGQGALAVECLAGSAAVADLCRPIDHADSREAILAERTVVAELGADCRSCLAVHVRHRGTAWDALGMVAGAEGGGLIQRTASASSANQAAAALLQELQTAGAREVLGLDRMDRRE